jgi:hypothetical protein
MMGMLPGNVCRTPAIHQTRKAGHTQRTARTGAVTLIQRFASALNLNIHFHMLLLDGVYASGREPHGQLRFQRVKAPDRAELAYLVSTLGERTGRYSCGCRYLNRRSAAFRWPSAVR